MANNNMSMRFRPEGYLSDEEEDSDDGFVFGVEKLDRNANNNRSDQDDNIGEGREGNSVDNHNGTGGSNTQIRGGFGLPAGYVPKNRGMGLPPGVKGSAVGMQQSPAAPQGLGRTQREKQKRVHTKETSQPSKSVLIEDFKTAVIRGNMDELQKYLDAGVPVDEVLRTGWTPLMYAGNFANVNAMKFLLERGADPNYHTDHYSVLMAVCASTRQDHEALCQCAQLLIDNKCNVNHFDRYHMSPIIYASRENKPLLVQLLIDNEANKDKQDSRGYSALSWAACKGHIRVVHILLEAGADAQKAACDGSKPADIALNNGHDKIASLLRRFAKGLDLSQESLFEPTQQSSQVQNDDDNMSRKSHSQYGALEMFLLDAELSHLIETFQENQVTFEAFLRFTDNDLQQMGITQLGVRKKLLDSISSTHKKEWLPTSLPSIQYNKLVTCDESVAMVANLSSHAAYMGTSAGYIADQIKSHPEILVNAKDGKMVIQLCNKTEEALAKVRVLYTELETLRKTVAKEVSQGDYEAPDLIQVQSQKTSNKSKHRKRRIAILASVTVIGLAIWKKDIVLRPALDRLTGLLGL